MLETDKRHGGEVSTQCLHSHTDHVCRLVTLKTKYTSFHSSAICIYLMSTDVNTSVKIIITFFRGALYIYTVLGPLLLKP